MDAVSDGMSDGMSDAVNTGHPWWQRGVVYQIYPRSFMDGSGDGVGDLAGLRDRLGYLRWLGIDALWLSPIFLSPMADFGYDVADYTAVDPLFGDLDDLDRLIADAHELGLRVLLDLVPNHTSEQHPWFLDSRSSRDAERRDWYLWRDPSPDGGPPNNWLSVFGGSAWEWDAHTGQYYYHAFLKEQPDLNWRHPEVARAMLDVMRFWFDRGVDGFRIDVISHMIKDAQFRDNPANPYHRAGDREYERLLPEFSSDRPEVLAIVERMRSVADEYEERLLIGEIYLPIERLVRYYGENGGGVHLPFNFQLITVQWDASAVAAIIDRYEDALPPGAWPNWVLGNHDQSRVASRIGAAQARVAAVLLLTLRGTPTIYYGDEIGMYDVQIPFEETRDPQAKDPGAGSRDPERTPMQWSDAAGAGFTSGRPWLPVAEDYRECNVERQRDEPDSMLALHRRLLRLRRAEPALAVGDYALLFLEGGVLAFLRSHGTDRLAVVLNLLGRPQVFRQAVAAGGTVLLSTRRSREGTRIDALCELEADEALVIRLDAV